MKTLTTIAALVFMTIGAYATTITLGDSNDLGLISKNQPADEASSATYINELLSRPLGTTFFDSGNGNTFTRSTHDPLSGVYPLATLTGEVSLGTSGNVNLGTGSFTYLLAKYDGQNFGSEVWYVGGLTGNITIPTTEEGFGLSHVYLYNPTGGVINPTGGDVPDHGSTLTMLGLAMTGLGMVKGKFGKRALA